jgi:hypothetical protein
MYKKQDHESFLFVNFWIIMLIDTETPCNLEERSGDIIARPTAILQFS